LCAEEFLTRTQVELVRAVQARRPELFLTGGSALAAFYLGHRRSVDIDLFTPDSDAYIGFAELVRAAAQQIQAEVRTGQGAFPHYRGFLVREGEFLALDLVVDTAPAVVAQKPVREGIRVDALEDILANKLVAAASRMEVRDFVDLYFIDRHGPSIFDAVPWALRKDPSLTVEALAHRLASGPWDAPLPKLVTSVSVGEIRDRLTDVAHRLARSAFPKNPSG
jgi:hypothetical protein